MMKDKTKDFIAITIIFIIAIVIHWFVSFPMAKHTGNDQLMTFQFLIAFAGAGYFAIVTVIITRKDNKKLIVR